MSPGPYERTSKIFFIRKKFSRASHAALNFVENQKCAVLIAKFTNFFDVFIVKFASNFCHNNIAGFYKVRRLVKNHHRHIDGGQRVTFALLVQKFRNRHAEQFAHVATGNHLFKTLFAGLFGYSVKSKIETIRSQIHEISALKI